MDRNSFSYRLQTALKRALDILAALVGLVLLSPLLLLIAIAIRLDSPGPIIYRQKRVGKNGKDFDLLKFRSMKVNGSDDSYLKYLQELIESERSAVGEPKPYRKMDNDSRVTRAGAILRNYYLDELPQLINILLGEMSLVGPRPHVQFEVAYYTSEQRRRLLVKPGMTGLWQVAGKADCSFSDLIAMDLEYIERWNFWLDIRLIFKTLSIMTRGGEAFWSRMTKQIPVRFKKSWGGPGPTPADPYGVTLSKDD